MNGGEKAKILIVDDQPSKLLTYEAILGELNETLITAGSAREAFDHLLKHDFALVLIDVYMPDLDGFQLASMMREHPRFEKTPIIFISAIHLTDLDRLRGYEQGAVDYVPVPIVPEILRAKVKVFVELYRKTRELQRMNEALEERVRQRTAELEAFGRRLQESEERFRLASEAAQFGTYDFNASSGRLHCSPQLKTLMGLTPNGEEAMDLEAFIALIHPNDRDLVRRILTGAERDEADRHSFEFRVISSDGGIHWLHGRGRTLFSPGSNGKAQMRVMGTLLDITERKQSEERQLLLMAELDHRVKNTLANVSAIARLSSRRTRSVGDFVQALDARIQAVSRAHSMLRRDNWTGIGLRGYLAELLSPFTASRSVNITLEGEEVRLKPRVAQSLSLVFHELATNAAKYGALSVPEGRVVISWERRPEKGPEWVKLSWTESGGPVVETEVTSGFGLTAIRAASSELAAEVSHQFTPSGVHFQLSGPIDQGNQPVRPAKPANLAAGAGHSAKSEANHYRILLVEDEAFVALQMKSDLEDAGHIVIGPAQDLWQGVELAKSKELDCALLDLRLGDEISTPVADALMMRGIPFAFATGYGDQSILPERLRSVPCLTKPYAVGGVAHFVDRLMMALADEQASSA